MAKIGNSAVRIIDESNLPANVNDAGRLEVDVASLSIGDVTVALDSADDSVECIQDTADDLNATVTQVSSERTITGTVTVDGSGVTQPVSGTLAVNTISGFATSDLQPSLGTAGSASANVITVQGVASMTPLTVDLAGNNDVTVTGTVGHDITTITSDEMDVTTAGTAEVLSTTQACKRVDIQAKVRNTGKIYIGGSTVDKYEGLELRGGDIYSLEIADLNDVYVDSGVDGEGVRYTYYG